MRISEAAVERLVRSRQRVADHGEVFTPTSLVNDMLDLVKSETERIDSRFLEPACGSGNFLVPVLERKLAVVKRRYRSSDFETRNYALLALMCIYGIELLPDNVIECRARLLSVFSEFVKVRQEDAFWHAAERVLALGIVQGDALSMTGASGEHITFPEWGYLGRGKFQRRDFRFDDLTQRSSAGIGLFTHLEEHEVFVPVRTFPAMSVQELAA
ncbi:N-6 DNA methylase [Glaciihabitans sp. UYNi722]|uniref:N-6 DNA methylase n=1 Tax=Glaciihabitans sp. UYNi722 TaxID=3156344 RepID=UPI003396E1EF